MYRSPVLSVIRFQKAFIAHIQNKGSHNGPCMMKHAEQSFHRLQNATFVDVIGMEEHADRCYAIVSNLCAIQRA